MRDPVSAWCGFGGTWRQPGPKPQPEVLLGLQSRPDRPGDAYRYAWEVETRERRDRSRSIMRGREEVLLEILEVRPERLRIGRTRLSIRGAGEDPGAEPNPYERAWTGVRVVFDADLRGTPQRARNWPEAREAMIANLRREAPGPSRDRADVEAFMDRTPADAAVELLAADLSALAGVRAGGPVPSGRRDLPPEFFERADGQKVKLVQTVDDALIDPDRARRERISRTSDGRTMIRTTATVCTETGWALALEFVVAESVAEARYEHVRIAKARRVDETA